MLVIFGAVFSLLVLLVLEDKRRKRKAKEWKHFGTYVKTVVGAEEKRRMIQKEKAERRAKARVKRRYKNVG